MPKRDDLDSILIIGAGPIVIGQACEFDYSGTQACIALREEGYRTILVNSNPATIMTDPATADATYIEPITPEQLIEIIKKEKPDAILPTMGGQTALNCAMSLDASGVLQELGVELIGANAEVIHRAEDRLSFKNAMTEIGLECPLAQQISNLEEAACALKLVGLPAVIRPSFTLGGQGGGIAETEDEFWSLIKGGLAASPVHTVLVEESVSGWKEYEMEVVRDKADNCIIICSIENVDPMGIHTGDSITVAPALTLTDKEYQRMRSASIACLRAIGVETGGSNVQFAINPKNGRMLVIEMNPRVSRSSALASKATGFPIAKIAAKLAIGYELWELQNDITQSTPASFEPTIDYIVTKIPRFAFEKFASTKAELATSMRSVGEVMAMGRSFQESIQKAYSGLETGLTGLDPVAFPNLADDATVAQAGVKEIILAELQKPTPDRLLKVAEALRRGLSPEDAHEASKIDPWFIARLHEIVQAEQRIQKTGLPQNALGLLELKQLGFSDARLAALSDDSETEIRNRRHNLGVRGCFKQIDTCAAEFGSKTPYLYHTFEVAQPGLSHNEAAPSDRNKVLILGGGPNRISQGIEFDYCCVHAAYALQDLGIEAIMVNCNPETVSTDYDTSDRLYFEPLTLEKILAIVREEETKGKVLGVIVQLGGQTPLKLARGLEAEGVPILGTSPDTIDLAENRELFSQLLDRLDILQPESGIARNESEALAVAERIGFPLMVRPSYVLGGRAMEIVYSVDELRRYIRDAVVVSGKDPVLLDRFLDNAIEVDVDALCDGTGVVVTGIMEHIERAGVHSGDSACVLPPHSLSPEMQQQIHDQSIALGLALNVIGLMNIQFAVQDNTLYVIEVNPRASRTVPFVAKATGIAVARYGVQVMAGKSLAELAVPHWQRPEDTAVKEAVFPFDRFPGSDVILGPEMRSTGEVMGTGKDMPTAFYKAQLAAGLRLPRAGSVLMSVRDADKKDAVVLAQKLKALGFNIICTQGTAQACNSAGVSVQTVQKISDSDTSADDSVSILQQGRVHLVFNTTQGRQSAQDSGAMRRAAREKGVPYFTTMAAALIAAQAMAIPEDELLLVTSTQDRLNTSSEAS